MYHYSLTFPLRCKLLDALVLELWPHVMQYYSESRKVHDAQMGIAEEAKAAGAVQPESAANAAAEAALAVTPARQTS